MSQTSRSFMPAEMEISTANSHQTITSDMTVNKIYDRAVFMYMVLVVASHLHLITRNLAIMTTHYLHNALCVACVYT